MSAYWLHTIDPVALALGPIKIHWYGLSYVAAFSAFYWLAKRRSRLYPEWDATAISDLLFYGALGAVIGGRVGYMLIYGHAELAADPLSIFKVWTGGMSFHGGLLGVIAVMIWYARKRSRHPFDLLDFVAPCVPVGLGFGRLGNFVNGELWGRFSDAPWAIIFPQSLGALQFNATELQAQYAAGALDRFARHPSPLYQALAEGVIMAALLWLLTCKRTPRYWASGWFALLYGVLRLITENFREPDPQMGYLAFGWLTTGQALSVPLIALGIGLLIASRRHAPVP
jgi:phosphatidylglycerol---prolipoprotein diacylglyceryl transferase